MIKIILLLLAGILASCGSTPAPRLPPTLEQAQEIDKEARRALRSGDLFRAQHEFTKTLQLRQSIDDSEGVATTIINLATVTHQMHDDEGALNWLNKITLEIPSVYPAALRMDASFRKAVILINLERLPEAESSLADAEKLCDKKCSLHFGLEGLHARLLLLKGDTQSALELALTVSKEAEINKEELANALRTIAAAEEKLARYTEALLHYQSALELDKTLSLSGRIGEDLAGLARVAKQLGRAQESSAYLKRAELVNNALRQSSGP
jgi:tetratricopeptide (TPR) repeat protein